MAVASTTCPVASMGESTAPSEHKEDVPSEDPEEYRRKFTVLLCSIGLVIVFNFVYILVLLASPLLQDLNVLSWSSLLGACVQEAEVALPSNACLFAAFAVFCNAYHLGLIALLYRTRRLYVVATLFLLYVDLGICAACLYFGVVSEFYMWLAAVIAMAFYIFGRHASRIFLAVVVLEGILLYPCSVYLVEPVAPLTLGPVERLAATCTLMVCVGVISHVHESAREATFDRLREANEKLRRSTEAKTLFLSAITHELRTPLTGIIGMANELLVLDEATTNNQRCTGESLDQTPELQPAASTTKLDEERLEAVRIIVTCARHLLGLVNDVLDFEKIESRQLDLEAIPFDVVREADQVMSMLAFPAATAHVRIVKEFGQVRRVRVGDPLRFRQVAFNMLSNAIKFTPPAGTVTLSLSDDEQGRLRVEVRDTGIGISPDAMKNLFKHFSQGSNDVCRRFGGSGLGLAICKHLVEAMQGEIGCASGGPNQGSTFWFALPLPVSSAELAAALDASTQLDFTIPATGAAKPGQEEQLHQQMAGSFGGAKVLLVEDNVVNQKVGRRLLERIGCEVHVAENGQACLDLLEREAFALIFMDCQMPVLDGYEATKRIRAREKAEQRERTPIVALTASCLKSDRQVCLDSGMDDWMSKPFDQAALATALRRWARLPLQQHSTQAQR